MIYDVEISELLCRHELIEANSLEEAKEIAENRYYNGQIVLSADDYVDGSVQIQAVEAYP